LQIDGRIPTNTTEAHLKNFYHCSWQIEHAQSDALCVTGAPVEKLRFEEVGYWQELCRVFDYVESRQMPAPNLCWAAQAPLY